MLQYTIITTSTTFIMLYCYCLLLLIIMVIVLFPAAIYNFLKQCVITVA